MSLHIARAVLAGIVATGGLTGVFVVSRTDAQPQRTETTQSSVVAPDAARCEALTGMKVDSGTVEGAEAFAAGQAIVGGTTVGAKASTSLCRVRVRLHPVPGSDIKVEVWLPVEWNDKLFGFGGGGFDGSLSATSGNFLNHAISQGYAAVATDVGHTPAGQTVEPWVHKQPEKVVDFGYRGNHLAAVVAKQIVAAYYGTPARRAYFQGCSNGGRDALMEASRYPDDYEGVIAGSPANRYIEVVTQLIWYSRAAASAPGLQSKLSLVHDAIVKKCDMLDGVKDGILENPRLCRFDPAVLECKGADGATCLTSAEVDALRKIYAGPRLSNGHQVIPGPMPGSEGVSGSWGAWVTGPVPALAGQEFYRWMVYDDPTWKVENFKLDRDYPVARARLGSIIDADSPDLTAFTRRGGKLIIYQGWDDPAITPGSTINYYEAVRRRIGPKAAKQVRLFMVPGMGHCAGGPGATSFDMQSALEKWVEHGEVPDRIIASKPDSGTPPLTHPLCVWPETAHYNGLGSTRDAANFTCKGPD